MTVKRPNRGKRQPPKKNASTLLLFAIFFTVSFCTVVGLEYIDYSHGKYSVIFNGVLKLPPRTASRPMVTSVPGFHQRLLAILEKADVKYDVFLDREGVYHIKIEMADHRYPPFLDKLRQAVGSSNGEVEFGETQELAGKTLHLYRLRFTGGFTHILLITRLKTVPAAITGKKTENRPEPVPPKLPLLGPVTRPETLPGTAGGRVAIIIDDIGYRENVSGQLQELGIPLTAAVIPDSPYAIEEVEKLHAFEIETIIHLPMQPNGSKTEVSRDQFVVADSSAEEIAALLRRARRVVPYARGLNNHMGSYITSHSDIMRLVLLAVKAEGFFFIDSKTTASTVAFEMARELGIPTRLRDIFLDDTPVYAHSINQIRNLVSIARQNGSALAIGHPFESTLRALHDSLLYMKESGIELVTASTLLE
jgi:uncharacterized protein